MTKLAKPIILVDDRLVAAGKANDSKVVLVDVIPMAAIFIVTSKWVLQVLRPSALDF